MSKSEPLSRDLITHKLQLVGYRELKLERKKENGLTNIWKSLSRNFALSRLSHEYDSLSFRCSLIYMNKHIIIIILVGIIHETHISLTNYQINEFF